MKFDWSQTVWPALFPSLKILNWYRFAVNVGLAQFVLYGFLHGRVTWRWWLALIVIQFGVTPALWWLGKHLLPRVVTERPVEVLPRKDDFLKMG